ncbi:MAG: DNA gyrase inhibitor YacG [Bosea sp. (in: a-proteobacteria)]
MSNDKSDSAPDSPANSSPEAAPAPLRLRPCPNCGKMAIQAFRPFCSKRCADVDLNRWLKGAYAIPGASLSEEDPDARPEDEG